MPIIAILERERERVSRMQGDGFASEPYGIMEVAMWLRTPLLVGF